MNYLKVLKLSAGFILAAAAAAAAGLSYSTSAGVITLLTIQNTKKETLLVTGKRYAAFLLALAAAWLCLPSSGYRLWGLGAFILLYAAACGAFSMNEALAMNTVLVTHFYTEGSMSWFWLRNEALLLLIGSGIGVVLNLYIPGSRKKIVGKQREIEETISCVLTDMKTGLTGSSKASCLLCKIPELEKNAEEALQEAYNNMGNTLLTDTRYYIQYMEMRLDQCRLLYRMQEDIGRLTYIPEQAGAVASLFGQAAATLHEFNNAEAMLSQTGKVLEEMKLEELPKCREEFENRALLYQLLLDFEEFLRIKQYFVLKLTAQQIRQFWSNGAGMFKKA